MIASYSVRPGDLRLLLGSPPLRCSTSSVVRLRTPTLLTPATYRPSHFTRNLKFLYGSNRVALTVNSAIVALLGRQAVAAAVFCWMPITTNSAGLSGANPTMMLTMPRSMSYCVVVSAVAADEVRLPRRRALERALPEQALQERADDSRICAHSGSSLGSNTTHCVLR